MKSTFLALIALAACTEPPPLYPATAPPEIAEACSLTVRKCTACHDRDRIVYARHSPDEWRNIVEKMRRLPGSSITAAEGDIILRCLIYRTQSTTSGWTLGPGAIASCAKPQPW